MTRSRANRLVALMLITALAFFGALFLFVEGIDALEGRSEFQFFADSPTYHAAVRGGLAHVDGIAGAMSVAFNYLGPFVVLKMAGENYYAVLVLNAVMLAFSVASLSRSLRVDALALLLILLINPLTISSLLSVNKEIISLVFVAFLVRALTIGSWSSLFLAMVTSVLVRWQLTALLIAVCLTMSSLNPFRKRRVTTFCLVLIGVSVLYVQLETALEPIRANFEYAAAQYEGSGFYETLVKLQDNGWYWAIFPVKAAHLLFGMGLRLDRLINPTNFYNDVWQLLHSTSMLLVFAALVVMRRFRFDDDLVYLSLIYIAVFAITPIYSPRYFYPAYVMWAAALCASESRQRVFGAYKARR